VDPTLSLEFTSSRVCNSGAKAVITVTEPLQGIFSKSSGALSVDVLTQRQDALESLVSVDIDSGSATIGAVTGQFAGFSAYGPGRLIVHAVEVTDEADVSGWGTVVLGSLTANRLLISAPDWTWAGFSVDMHVDSGEVTQSVNVSIKSSGTVTLGSLTASSATIFSSGNASISGMISKNLYVQSSGGGVINTSATESFHGSCSGNASVYITGGAQVSGSCQ